MAEDAAWLPFWEGFRVEALEVGAEGGGSTWCLTLGSPGAAAVAGGRVNRCTSVSSGSSETYRCWATESC